jgi:GTP1/Obg family GTP-binding protein
MKMQTAPIETHIEFHQEVLKWITDSNGKHGSLSVINVHLRMIDDFLKTYVRPLFEIRNQFEEMKKKYPDELKALQQQISAGAH